MAQGSGRFTDGRVPDSGIAALFEPAHRWQRWLDVESALAQAQAAEGVIPSEAATAIADGAAIERIGVDRITAGIAATSHPLMAMVSELTRVVSDPHGGWVHWGATTQNITQTGAVVIVREVHDVLLRLIGDVLTAMARLADQGAEMVAAGRTHGQHAVPVTFGFKVAAWIDEFCRHVERLREVEKRVFTAMMGGAVGNFASSGAVGPAVQARVADLLGLRPMRVPSRAISDPLAEYVCILALMAGSGGRIAAQVYSLMTTEIAEVAEPAPAGTIGSSTMPQKRNPQLADDCVTISAQLRALVPLALEGMLHDHEVDGGHSAMTDDALERACVPSGELLTRLSVILAGLELDAARMRHNLDLTGGLISAERVMLALGGAIGRQEAHELIGAAASRSVAAGVPFADVLAQDPRIAGVLGESGIAALLDPTTELGLSTELAHEAAGRARNTAAELIRDAR